MVVITALVVITMMLTTMMMMMMMPMHIDNELADAPQMGSVGDRSEVVRFTPTPPPLNYYSTPPTLQNCNTLCMSARRAAAARSAPTKEP